MKQKNGPFQPGRKRFKEFTAKVIFFILGRAFQSLSKIDHDIQTEVAEWEENFTLMLKVQPNGPQMGWKKEYGVIKYLGSKIQDADLILNFKNIDSAFKVLTPQISIPQGNAEHRLSIVGDLSRTTAYVRCVNKILFYLYPRFICKRLVKRLPAMDFKAQQTRLYVYLIGIPFGK